MRGEVKNMGFEEEYSKINKSKDVYFPVSYILGENGRIDKYILVNAATDKLEYKTTMEIRDQIKKVGNIRGFSGAIRSSLRLDTYFDRIKETKHHVSEADMGNLENQVGRRNPVNMSDMSNGTWVVYSWIIRDGATPFKIINNIGEVHTETLQQIKDRVNNGETVLGIKKTETVDDNGEKVEKWQLSPELSINILGHRVVG